MAANILVFGAGGHGRVVMDAALTTGEWGEYLFVDESPAASTFLALPVLGLSSISPTLKRDAEWVVAIGNNAIREQKYRLLLAEGVRYGQVLHPSAIISTHSQLGPGSVALAGSIVNCRSYIEENVILNTGSIVEHDCHVGASSHLSPRVVLAGGVTIGARTWVGAGAVIKEGVKLGCDVVVGAGSVVLNDIDDGLVVAGVPAKRIR